MSTQKIIVGLGEVLWDIYPDAKYIGGAPANVALHARQLGGEAIVVSAVGQDQEGEEIIAILGNRDIGTEYIQTYKEKPTGSVRVQIDEKGLPTFLCSRDVAFDHIQWNQEMKALAGEIDAVVVGTLAQRNHTSRNTIQLFLEHASHALRVFDVNFRKWDDVTNLMVQETLIHTDILKLNEVEMRQMWKAFRQDDKSIPAFFNWLIDKYSLKLVALSLGEKGCMLTDGNEHIVSPGVRIQPADTTGCGDAFVASLIMGYLQGEDLDTIAESMNYLGAFVAVRQGAAPEYDKEALDHFIRTQPDRSQERLEF